MQADNQTTDNTNNELMQPTVGVYPLTPFSVSFFHHYNIDKIICKKDGVSYEKLKKTPVLKVNINDELIEHEISNQLGNGLLESLEKKQLPMVLLCTPTYTSLGDFIDELSSIALFLMEKERLKAHTSLKRFYFPTIILLSNGIIYDEVVYNLKSKLKEHEIPEDISNNIASKIVRASILNDVYKENDIYFPDQKTPLKIALPKFPLFSQVVDILNKNDFSFSVNTNPHRVEFEKAMINIATNTVALVFALDQTNLKLRKINIKEALSPSNHVHATLVNDAQKAVFEIGKKAGAFTEIEVFEKVWKPRKEQLLELRGFEISNSLHNFKNMIKNNTLPETHFPSEYALTYPLKCYARHYELYEEIILLEELDKMLKNNLEFAHKNHQKIIFTF